MNRILAALLALVATQAFSQSYPNKPVRVIVPFATGSASDLIGRTVADRLTQALGQPFLVENRPGAGGTIGTEVVAKAPPDGYTLLVTTAATPITATAVRGLKYETAAFASITVLTHSPLGFAAHPQFAPKTVRQFIDYAKANPGKVNFGSLGIATSHHVTGEKLKLDAGIDMVHVPYKGSGAAHADLMGGQIQVAWFGYAAPPGTPKDIVAKLNAEIVKALAIPEIRQRLVEGGSEVIGNSPEAADKFLQSEIARWGAVVKAANIRLD